VRADDNRLSGVARRCIMAGQVNTACPISLSWEGDIMPAGRDYLIKTIERYCPDSSPYRVALKQKLLDQARRDNQNWREESLPVLRRMAELVQDLAQRGVV
jgi:hypothetical protein